MEPVFNWKPIPNRNALTQQKIAYLTVSKKTVSLSKYAAERLSFNPVVDIDEVNKAIRLRPAEAGETAYSIAHPGAQRKSSMFSCKTGLPEGRYVSLLDPHVFVLEKTPMLPHQVATVPHKG